MCTCWDIFKNAYWPLQTTQNIYALNSNPWTCPIRRIQIKHSSVLCIRGQILYLQWPWTGPLSYNIPLTIPFGLARVVPPLRFCSDKPLITSPFYKTWPHLTPLTSTLMNKKSSTFKILVSTCKTTQCQNPQYLTCKTYCH